MIDGLRYPSAQLVGNPPEYWSRKGRPVRMIDGTIVELPDTLKTNNKNGCPLARIVGIIYLLVEG